MQIPPFSSAHPLSRRTFLTFSGLGLTGLLAACGGAAAHTPTPTPTTQKAPPTVVPTRPALPTEADWSALAKSLHGTLVRPQNAGYAGAHQLFNTRFDHI